MAHITRYDATNPYLAFQRSSKPKRVIYLRGARIGKLLVSLNLEGYLCFVVCTYKNEALLAFSFGEYYNVLSICT